MQRFISAVMLIAFVGSGLAGWPPVAAEEVSAETSQRLREAVERLRENQDEGIGVPAQAALTEEELDTLVAPVALYPDSLLAQVLVAATYPLQIAEADQLIAASDDMSDQELADALAAEDWDPSVLVLLSGFPTVITRMAEDLDATERLGAAMVGQDEDVLTAVQRMRAEAEAAGNLSSNEAQVVTREQDQISIRPARRDLVYVPQYDPRTVYVSNRSAVPYAQPAQNGFNGQNALVIGAVAFGAALLVGEIFGDDDEKDSGWDDYWRRDRVIDWRDRRFYPRSDRDERHSSWGQERDRYWDRSDREWRRDDDARRHYEAERRSALRWTALREQRDEPGVASWREKARLEKAREDRAAALRREERAKRVEDDGKAARREAARREKAADSEKAEQRAEAERKKDREREAQQAKGAAKATDPVKPKPAARVDKAKKPEPVKAAPKPAAQANGKAEPAKKPDPKPEAQAEKKPESAKEPQPAKKPAPQAVKQADKPAKKPVAQPAKQASEPARKQAKSVKAQPVAAQKPPRQQSAQPVAAQKPPRQQSAQPVAAQKPPSQQPRSADQAKSKPKPASAKACPAGEKGKACRAARS